MATLPRRFASLLLLASTLPAIAAENQPLTPADRAKKDLEFLAGPDCDGRGLETKGILKAGEYIAEQFKAAGLKPAFKESYFQPFDVPGPSKLGTPVTFVLKNGDKTYEPKVNDGFVATLASAGSKTKAAVVFAGYGITSKDPKYDDYDGLDAKGKIVVVLRRTPQADDEKGMFGPNSPHAPFVAKIQNAIDHGAIGVIFVSDAATAGKDDKHVPPEVTAGMQMPGGPVLHVKREVVDALLQDRNTNLADWEKQVNKTGAPNSFELKGWEAESEVTIVKTKFPTRNVVGVCEGGGDLKDETVVIGAHYDHLGSGEGGSFPANKGKTHFGADDNASGTTGLLALARRYGGMKDRTGRRLVFVAFSGEEQGLFGSKHYCKEPAFPLEKTAFMLNMDMIGRVTPVDDKDKDGKEVKKDRLVVYGTGTSTGLDKLVEEKNAKPNFKLLKIEGGTGPSDHTSFYTKKVPVLFFFTGTHKDYHRPTDTPDKINVDGLVKVADYVAAFADHFATVKDKPDWIKTKGGGEDPTDPNRGSRVSVPRIQFAPGNYGEEDRGVLVESVTEGGPAAKGGLKEGDYIIDVAGTPVKNMTGYMQAMSKVKPDVEIEITVQRKDKQVKLKVTPVK